MNSSYTWLGKRVIHSAFVGSYSFEKVSYLFLLLSASKWDYELELEFHLIST